MAERQKPKVSILCVAEAVFVTEAVAVLMSGCRRKSVKCVVALKWVFFTQRLPISQVRTHIYTYTHTSIVKVRHILLVVFVFFFFLFLAKSTMLLNSTCFTRFYRLLFAFVLQRNSYAMTLVLLASASHIDMYICMVWR